MAKLDGPWMGEGGETVLEARDLACIRGEHAVFSGLSFGVASGGALLLTGANGAGKSSLLRVLAGLLDPAEGALLWQGEDALADRAAHAGRLRYLSHLDALKPALSLRENLLFDAAIRGGGIGAALEAVGLASLADVPARLLSAGQRRRLALGRLALGTAPLWLLDEPTTGLDTASIERLGALLARHRALGGMVIAATHLPLPLPGAAELRL